MEVHEGQSPLHGPHMRSWHASLLVSLSNISHFHVILTQTWLGSLPLVPAEGPSHLHPHNLHQHHLHPQINPAFIRRVRRPCPMPIPQAFIPDFLPLPIYSEPLRRQPLPQYSLPNLPFLAESLRPSRQALQQPGSQSPPSLTSSIRSNPAPPRRQARQPSLLQLLLSRIGRFSRGSSPGSLRRAASR